MLSPIGSTNPEYYIIGHVAFEDENVLFDANSNRANSYLHGVLNSLNINEMNCRFNKLIPYYIENTYNIPEDELELLKSNLYNDISNSDPKIIIVFGSEVSKLFLGDRFRYMKSSHGRLFDVVVNNREYKLLVTYSPTFITKSYDDPDDHRDMSEFSDAFYNDITYCTRYVNGDLVDISSKDLRYAQTYDEFKDYFDNYLKDAEMPSYDIESNAKDPRCADFRIVGFSLSKDGSSGIYVIRNTLEYSMPEDDWNKCVELTKDYLMSRKCLVHNIMYEKPATLNEWNINITNFEDSLIKARLLLGGKTGAGLKDQCILNLGYPEWDADLGHYISYFTVLWNNLYPTAAGNHRWDYDVLLESGFQGLINKYEEYYSLEEIQTKYSNKEKLSREEQCYEATQNLTSLLYEYYEESEIDHILTLVGKELVNLIEIRYSGILPYSSIPMRIITKYGAMDAVATHDLDRFLSKRLDNESTDTVNLWNGYRVMKEHFIVGTHLEMNGLYWNEDVAKSNYEWLAGTAKESLRNCIMSGFLDDQIIDNSMYLLQEEVQNNRMDYVEQVLGPFEMQAKGIKIISTGRRISFKNLLWELPKEFIDSMRPWILSKSKELLMDDNVHKSYEDFKYIFNPASNKNTQLLDKILVTKEIQIGYLIVKMRDMLESESFDINSIPMPDRLLFKVIQDTDKYNKSDECKEKISARTLFLKIDKTLESISINSKVIYNLIDEAVHYHLDGTSEPVMLKLFDYYEAIGIDIEDESTYTDEFRFFYNFRMYKKCTKLISSYINGDKIGRGSVWIVNKKDIDENKIEPIRTKRYDWNKEKSDDEEYLLQPIWKVCTAETLRWRSAVHTIPAGRVVKGMYTSRYKGGVIAAPDYCVVGESKIRLADNSTPMVKDLEGLKEFYTYSYDQNTHKVVIGHGHDCRIVKKVYQTYKIYTNDGSVVETSAEHRFWSNKLNNWKQASELEVGESLKAYEIIRRKHPRFERYNRLGVVQDDGEFIYTQQLADDYNVKYRVYSDKEYKHKNIHHKDKDPDNNNPWNIEPMEASDHRAFHAEEQWSNEERLYDGETYREKMTRITTDNFNATRLEVNQNPEFIQRRKNGRLKTGFSRFEDGMKLMLEYHSPREILLDYSYFSTYDEELLKLSGLSKMPKGMGSRFILDQRISFYDYLVDHQELWSDQVEDIDSVLSDLELINQINNSNKASYKEVCWIKKLYRCIEDESLSTDDWDKSIKILKENGIIGKYKGRWWSTVINIFDSKENLDKYCRKNHYITKIEIVDYPEGLDLYSFTVDDYHNFLFDNGILSHQSQLEVRITAGLSNCTPMIEAYRNGEDVHLRTACGIFRKKPEEITKVERRFCLVGSTRIILPNGETPTIKELSDYQNIPSFSYNESTNKVIIDNMIQSRITQYVTHTVRLYFDETNYIECTPDHPMLLAMGSYKEAKDCGGYSLETIYCKKTDNTVRVAKRDPQLSRMVIKIDEVKYDEPIPVYDLFINENHNFPVLIDTIDSDQVVGVFVHNSKMGTFRILYGSTPEGFARQFLDNDVALARQIFNGFYETYPQIKEYMDKRHAEVEKYGKISCEKVGYFLNIDVANDPEGIEGAYRKAGNYGIQSQGSMVGGYVLSSINNYFMENNLYTKPISFIHDSLEFDIHPMELFQVAPVILRMMNDIPINEFDILTAADVTIGTSMGMENEIKEMKFSDDNNEGWLTLEGFEDDLDDLYQHWINNAGYKLVEYEDIGEPEQVYTRKRELMQEKLALGPFLGKTRNLITRKFHIIMK